MSFQIFLKDGRLPMLVGNSTRSDFVKNLEETMMQEVGQHYDEYVLYKEGHSKPLELRIKLYILHPRVTCSQISPATKSGLGNLLLRSTPTKLLYDFKQCQCITFIL